MPADVPLPVGIVTFLLTDIVGSTKLWEESPDLMPDVLARHDALARALVEANHGVLIKSRGEGDSLFCVFESAANAVSAACSMQRALLMEPWAVQTSLQVRMALHSGEVTLRDGDYYGPTINRCARLRAIAVGGQILLTEAAAKRASGGLPPGASLTTPFERKLKDLNQSENIYQLRHPELPILELSATQPNNLPQQNTSFEGREKDLSKVKTLLHGSRMVTLTGEGGSGKTRLALQTAADLLDEEGDGIWFANLAALSNGDLVPQTVASVLEVREVAQNPLTQTIIQSLRDKHVLLILDNCEHLLTACALFCQAVLAACPHVRILTTSREGVGVSGETTYRIPSLSLPPSSKPATAQNVLESEAARLFVVRARAAQPAFHLTDANAHAIAQICTRLDGIPFAIELAAARIRALPVEQIAVRLDDRFRLLTGGARTALPRQQTLRATLDWSYALLSPEEQTLLKRLSVFSGGWTLEAAEAVCADTDDTDDSEA